VDNKTNITEKELLMNLNKPDNHRPPVIFQNSYFVTNQRDANVQGDDSKDVHEVGTDLSVIREEQMKNKKTNCPCMGLGTTVHFWELFRLPQ
jgi:hypothetical protein